MYFLYFERLDDLIKGMIAYLYFNPLKRDAGQQRFNKFIENKEQYDSSKCWAFVISISERN